MVISHKNKKFFNQQVFKKTGMIRREQNKEIPPKEFKKQKPLKPISPV